VLHEELTKIAEVEQVTAYRNADAETIPSSILRRIEEATVDWVTLTSPAIASRFFSLLTDRARASLGRRVRLASLSPVTSAEVERLGGEVAVEAAVHTWDGLIEAIASAPTAVD
jgi:uroporphyrinogen III methyltransferase/synthase